MASRPLALVVCGIGLSTVAMSGLAGTTGGDCAGSSSDPTTGAPQHEEHEPDSSGMPRPMKRLDASQRKELLETIKARTGRTGERSADP